MKTIYVCSPLRGDIRGNIEKAKRYCRHIAVCGDIPIAPHVYCTQFLDDTRESERKIGMTIGLELLKICDELWAFGDRVSEGMAAEIEIARRRRMAIRHIKSDGPYEE
jgi:hypothetical protein